VVSSQGFTYFCQAISNTALNFIDLVAKRQSVRRYLPRNIEPEKIERCLEAARLAPSASNSQPWSFIVVDDPGLKNKVARQTYGNIIAFNKFVMTAPVLVVFIVEKPKVITRLGSMIKKLDYPLIDIGIAAEHFCLQATDEGLGTCMLGWFNARPIKKLLHVPMSKTIGLIISVGYPPEDYRVRAKTRKSLEEVVRYNSYAHNGSTMETTAFQSEPENEHIPVDEP
jgi:nitroreductase